MDFWRPFRNGPSEVFTTIGNYKQQWREVAFNGEMYHWSKHHEFLKIIDLPRRTSQPFELALGSCEPQEQKELEAHGWRIRGADEISTDADQYRRYITTSRGEFTVAKDQNVRLKSGWFSDRSATYLASGLPVITQDTAFDAALPVGKGLFAFSNLEQAADAVEAINADYPGNQRTSEEIAREYFAHDKVLGPLLEACGLARLAIAPRPAAPPAPPLEALRARVEVQCPPIVEPASVLKLSCEVENLGSACMLSLPPNPVFVSYKWFDAKTGQRFEHEGLRTSLPGTLLPRGHAKCELIVRTPAVEGEFILRATLVQEYISWFDDLDAASACNVRVTVRSAAPAVPALTEAASR